MDTPHVYDPEIRTLIRKYPMKDQGEENNKTDIVAVEAQANQRKQLDKMLKIIEGVESEN